MGVKKIDDFAKLLKIKRYAENTIASYISFLQLYESMFKIKDFEKLKNRDILNFCYQYISHKEFSYSSQKQLLSAIKLFYSEMYDRYVNLDAVRPKFKPKSNPVILSKNEVRRLLNCIENTKHKSMLTCVYSLGLRSGELINLKVNDLDGGRNLIHVINSKGNKDRDVMFPHKLKVMLRDYYKEYKPKVYLFEGSKGGKYSSSSLQKVLKSNIARAKINKQVTLHSLRHSFATHLLEDGISLAHIQKLLGHNSIKTTMIYTHVANDSLLKIKSPLDTL